MQSDQLPTALAEVARGRDHLDTKEFSRVFLRAEQSARKNYCLAGQSWGVVPIKRFGRLMWPVSQTAAILYGGDTK